MVVDSVRNTFEEKLFENVKTEQSVRMPIPAPYGIVLLGALIDGDAWEGWSTIVRPPELQLRCEAPKEAKPGARITVTLKTNLKDRVVPVQLIVKDQRLLAPSDPQVEFAACMKRNLQQWSKLSGTGKIERQLAHLDRNRPYGPMRRGFAMPRAMVAFAASAPSSGGVAPTMHL